MRYLPHLLLLLTAVLLVFTKVATGDTLVTVQWTQPSTCCPQVDGWVVWTQYEDEPTAIPTRDIRFSTATPSSGGVYSTSVLWDPRSPMNILLSAYTDNGGVSAAPYVKVMLPSEYPRACRADFTGDGIVGGEDFGFFLLAFGRLCEP